MSEAFKYDPMKSIDGSNGFSNGEREERAFRALSKYKRGLGESGAPDADTMRDLVSDLGHWADSHGLEFREEVEMALRRWEEER